MTTLFLEAAAGTKTPIHLTPGLHTAGGSPKDAIRIDGAPGRLLEVEVAAETLIVVARVPGCTLGSQPMKVGDRWLLRAGQSVGLHGNLLHAEAHAAKPTPADQGTAALARGVLGSAGLGGASPLPSLVWLNGRDCGKRVTLLDEATFLGRGDGAAARVRDALASRTHAKLTLRDGAARLQHLASSNGLHVNGQPVTGEVALFGGEVLRLGETELLFDAALERPKPAAQPVPEVAPAQAAPAAKPASRRRLPLFELAMVSGASAAGAALTAAIWMLAR